MFENYKPISDIRHSYFRESSIINNPMYLESMALGPRPGNYGIIDV